MRRSNSSGSGADPTAARGQLPGSAPTLFEVAQEYHIKWIPVFSALNKRGSILGRATKSLHGALPSSGQTESEPQLRKQAGLWIHCPEGSSFSSWPCALALEKTLCCVYRTPKTPSRAAPRSDSGLSESLILFIRDEPTRLTAWNFPNSGSVDVGHDIAVLLSLRVRALDLGLGVYTAFAATLPGKCGRTSWTRESSALERGSRASVTGRELTESCPWNKARRGPH